MATATQTPTAVVLSASEKAAKVVTTSITTLAKMMDDLNVYKEQVEELTEAVLIKSSEIQKLDEEYKIKSDKLASDINEKVRASKVDLELTIKANKDNALKTLLEAAGLVSITPSKLHDLEETISTLENNQSIAIKNAVENVTRTLKAEHANDVSTIKLQNTAETAKVNAELDAKDAKIKFLEDQLRSANETITAERNARIEIAKSAAQPTINVGTAGK